MDSLGVGAIEIRRKNAPNHWQRRQEVLKHLPDDAGMPFVFLDDALIDLGALGLPLVIPGQPVAMGGHEGQEPHMWFLPLVHPGTSCASDLMGWVVLHRGMIYRVITGVEGTKKHSHVPATSSEALCTNR